MSNTRYAGRSNATLRLFGRSKQTRNDRPLIRLALALDGEGFPRWAGIVPGTVSETSTLQDALQHLGALGAGGVQPTVVMDAGIASAGNLDWLHKQGYDWICVSREAKPERSGGEPAASVRTSAGYRVRSWPLPHGGEDRDVCGPKGSAAPREERVYVVSESRWRTADAMLARQRRRFSKPRCLKSFDKVQRKAVRLIERNAKLASQYEITVPPGEKGLAAAVAFEPRPAHAAAASVCGAYVLRTSHTAWGEERILRAYWSLTEVEATFWSLKSELGLRPVYHRLGRRIEAHLFISVLAYAGRRSGRDSRTGRALLRPCGRSTVPWSASARTPARTRPPTRSRGPPASRQACIASR